METAITSFGFGTLGQNPGQYSIRAGSLDGRKESCTSHLPSSRAYLVPEGGIRRMHGKKLSKLRSSMWGGALVAPARPVCVCGTVKKERKAFDELRNKSGDVATKHATKMNLDQYMVTLDHPVGLRFAQTSSGEIYVQAVAKNGNADRARIIMVGDVLKKVSVRADDNMLDPGDFGRTMKEVRERNEPVNFVFERAPPLFRSRLITSSEAPLNVGSAAVSTWDNRNLSSATPSEGQEGGGFVTYSSRILVPEAVHGLVHALRDLVHPAGSTKGGDSGDPVRDSEGASTGLSYEEGKIFLFTDDHRHGIEWTHGSYDQEEYLSALQRSDGDLGYNPSLGINYTKITEQIYVGSCIQNESDLKKLTDKLTVTAVLNLQRKSEQDNWGIDGEAIEKHAREKGVIVVNYPIRDVDSFDLRRRLPLVVGVLYRLLHRGHRVYVTCTTGLDRSPACVIAYFHWIQDVALQEAVDYIKKLHPCGPDRPALVWATWDLVAMVEEEHKGPSTHAVQFVWNHGCRDGEEVLLVGEFNGGWNKPIKAVHASGPKYTVDLHLPQGKYLYKFIVGGHWRHSNSLPTQGDQGGNINNVIKVGDVATTKFDAPHRAHIKELNSIKVIERPLTEDERYTLAFASRRMAFAVNPLTFFPKRQ